MFYIKPNNFNIVYFGFKVSRINDCRNYKNVDNYGYSRKLLINALLYFILSDNQGC